MKRTTRASLWILFAAAAGALPAQTASTDGLGAERTAMAATADLLAREHLSHHPLDDEISHRALRAFLTTLDPFKLYFDAADAERLAQRGDELDDMMIAGDPTYALAAHELLADRADERTDLALQLLKRTPDFTVDEEFVIDPDATEWARTAAELSDRWRRRIKYDLLVLKTEEVDGDAARERLRRRYIRACERIHRQKPTDIVAGFIAAVTHSYDPHSEFLPPRAAEDFAIHMRLDYEGIGAQLREDDGRAVIARIIPGGAAARNGALNAGDRILGVGQGEDGDLENVEELELNDIVDRIRGPEGSLVRLQVVAPSGGPARTVILRRAKTELADARAQSRILERTPSGSPVRVGVVELGSFYGTGDGPTASGDVRRILRAFATERVAAVVLDLRGNGGGLLSEAIAVAGLFIDNGPVVQVRGTDGRIEVMSDLERGTEWAGPLVVLTDRFSASASEIVAGCLQDYGRAIVVGDISTHGKGTVQAVLDLARQRRNRPGSLGALMLTIQQFYRPGGSSTQVRGVAADVVLPSLAAAIDGGEGELPYALPWNRVPAADFVRSGSVDRHLVQALETASLERRAHLPRFAGLETAIAAAKARARSVPLRETAFMAMREQLNAAGRPETGDEPQTTREMALQEAADIAADAERLSR